MRNRNIKIYLSIFVCFMGMLFSCENRIEDVNELTSQKKIPVSTSTNIELIYSDSANMIMKLIAPKIDRFVEEEGAYDEFKEGVKFIFYNKKGKPESQITSKYGIHYVTSEIMEAKNDVVVINKKGEQLNTEHLIWDVKKEKIHTEEFVKIQTGSEILYGNGLESNQDFTEYKILNIKGVIDIEDETGKSK